MQSLGQVTTAQALKDKRSKKYQLGVFREILLRVGADRWPGQPLVDRIAGSDGHRTLVLGCDAPLGLLIYYDQESIVRAVNDELVSAGLPDLVVSGIRIVNRNASSS